MSTFNLIRTIFKPLFWPLIALIIISAMGTIGYIWIEKFSFGDALYMTIITEFTVGFSEVQPLTDEGRYFTIFLIVISFGVFAFAVTSITTFITGGEYKKKLFKLKHLEYMNKLQNHAIICGYGRVGKKAANELLKQSKEIVIIENDLRLIDEDNITMVNGDATMDEILLQAGIENASDIIVALPSDSDNLMVIVTARALNPKINIVARVSNKVNEMKLKSAGAHHIISPDAVGGKTMARMVIKPDLMEFTERITASSNDDVSLDEIIFTDQTNKNISIKEFDKDFLAGCLIVGYKTEKGEFIINPSFETKIESGTKLFVLGKKDQISQLHKNIGN